MDQIKVHSRRMQKSIDGNRNLFVGYITEMCIRDRGCTKELLKNENLTSNEVLSYCYDK